MMEAHSSLIKEPIMEQRVDFYSASKEAIEAMLSLEKAVAKLGLEPQLVDLIKLRASQINGCAFCVDLHTREARQSGETERRLYAVSVWRETPFFTERERAALAWTEAITLIADTHAPDEDYALLAANFNKKEMTDLTLAIATINAWNRLAVGFRKGPSK
jgi:AhpD family alkylhydroperoxidase